MFRRNSQPDYYSLLQVSPDASSEDIAESYRRLADLYSTERMSDAPPEFQEQAAAKRQELLIAFETLSDAQRRAAYDRKIGRASERGQALDGIVADGDAAAVDYRPLPPARRKERDRSAEPTGSRVQGRSTARSGVRGWLPVIGVALVALAVLLVIVLSPVRALSGSSAVATPVLPNVQLPFTDVQLQQFRASAERTNAFENWVALGNALFDNMQTMRENALQSPQYRNSLSNWLQAADAYQRALTLRDDPVVRSDRAVALLNYGLDAPDQQRIAAAIAEVEAGIAANVTEPRALLNYGLILTSINPPRTDEALAQWRKIVEVAPQSPEVERAKLLIEIYGR